MEKQREDEIRTICAEAKEDLNKLYEEIKVLEKDKQFWVKKCDGYKNMFERVKVELSHNAFLKEQFQYL